MATYVIPDFYNVTQFFFIRFLGKNRSKLHEKDLIDLVATIIQFEVIRINHVEVG